MFNIENVNKRFRCRMLVIGVGGAGNNAVNRMIDMGMGGVDYLSINTDNQDLDNNKSPQILHIGNRMLGVRMFRVRYCGCRLSIGYNIRDEVCPSSAVF